ncbi:antiholin-like protein LrgB [Vagococcus sp. DIV0080]|jgi:holin-like protein LrgB|uniref:Antiholin-like protein LrgB n=1 Tax=Candidatus Vagococcus giribetii TaxID=2230876 RepID=A0ABS3HRK2_9ENTE|nr:antiholin-like protein LrgB [Vagococcus sp. DIV0080]MBO0475506.1 antiholin-like protein LrgB [Vagococcus sp. DIV0080]
MTPYVGIMITLVAFGIGAILFKWSKGFFLFTPLFVGMVLGIVILQVTGISYEEYNEGGKVISFFLDPATVAFAIPLYKKRDVLKKYALEIMLSLTIGTSVALFVIIAVGKIMNVHNDITLAILPQAATTAIAVPVSKSIGGLTSITAFAVIFTAVLIYALGGNLIKFFGIKHPISRGLALGASGHALGVSVGLELGETEAAMASLSVVVVGLVTVILVPIFATLINI